MTPVISIEPVGVSLHSMHTVSCECGWTIHGLSATRAVLARDKHRAMHAAVDVPVRPLWDD